MITKKWVRFPWPELWSDVILTDRQNRARLSMRSVGHTIKLVKSFTDPQASVHQYWTCQCGGLIHWSVLLYHHPLGATQVKIFHYPPPSFWEAGAQICRIFIYLNANLRSSVNYLIVRVQFSDLYLKVLTSSGDNTARAKNHQSPKTTKDGSYLYKYILQDTECKRYSLQS